MTRPEQKREERAAVEQYLQATGFEGEVEDGADPPDFILTTDHKKVALEVTGYHQPLKTSEGHTRREVEAAWTEVRKYVVSYRERNSALGKLSVRLEFLRLSVPRTKEIASFVEAVTAEIVSNRAAINEKTYRVLIEESDAPILKKYLKCIRVREVDCYMEWDWNHDFAGVGTSDDEMMLAIGKKLTDYRRPEGVDENHLIVAGWGGHLSQVAAPMHEQELASFKNLNQALEASAFDCVAILCFRDFVWRRGLGWEPLMAPKTAA